MAEAPIYVGSGKKGKWEGSVVLGFKKDDLKTLAEHLNENGWVNVIVSPQRENKGLIAKNTIKMFYF